MSVPVSPEPIDLAELARSTGGDAQLAAEVLDLFAQQSRLAVNRLQTALAEADAKTWRGTAHSLKGSALSVGAGGLAEIAGRAEQIDPAAAPYNAAETLRTVQAGVCEVAAFVEAALRARSAGTA